MKLLLFLLSVVTAVLANDFVWQNDKEYVYSINSESILTFNTNGDQYTGVVVKGLLTIQANSNNNLTAKVTDAKYAPFHHELTKAWDYNIDYTDLKFQKFPLSDTPFGIILEHDIIVDLILDASVPIWEMNMLKSFVSQLQLGLKRQNAIEGMPKVFNVERGVSNFSSMEETITGKCQVDYQIEPHAESTNPDKPKIISVPDVKEVEGHMYVRKEKNFSNCDRTVLFHFGFSGRNNFSLGSIEEDNFFSRASISDVVLAGDSNNLIILTSQTTDTVLQRLNLIDQLQAWVSAKVNLTLEKFHDVTEPMTVPQSSQSVGSLVYEYNSPFRTKKLMAGKKENLQAKPSIEKAPDFPLFPYFVGKGGHSIFFSKEKDQIQKVISLCEEIGKELQSPNEMLQKQTLEKTTILKRLIRSMGAQQLATVREKLYVSGDDAKAKGDGDYLAKLTSWAVFRDSVVQAGTGPALLTISNLISDGLVKGQDGGFMISMLSKKVITPTEDYIEGFYRLVVTMKETLQDYHLSKAAVLSFAEIIRTSAVSKSSARNLHPIYALKDVIPPTDNTILEKYLPYFATNLEEAIKAKDSLQAQIFITAIGKISHPKILNIFQPYLENKQSATKFQRAWMILSLERLAKSSPETARPVLYKIYENMENDYEIRCAAVFVLMMTDPPKDMLEKMANMTHHDVSDDVSAAVKSSIESASKMDQDSDFKEKAQAVLELLTHKVLKDKLNYNEFFNTSMLGRSMQLESYTHVLGDDKMFPKTLYRIALGTFGGLKFPSVRNGLAMTSFEDFVRALDDLVDGDDGLEDGKGKIDENGRWTPGNIARKLGVQGDSEKVKEIFEGNFFLDTPMIDYFMPFDQKSLESVPEVLKNYLKKLKDGGLKNILRYYSYDVAMSFPLETGFPYEFIMEIPALDKLEVTSQMSNENPKGQTSIPDSADIDAKIKLISAFNIQGQAGFLTPFDSMQYTSGFNCHIQVHLPVHLGLKFDTVNGQYGLSIEPYEKGQTYDILQIKVYTYTSNMKVTNPKPVTQVENTKIIKFNTRLNERVFGLGLGGRLEYDYGTDPGDAESMGYRPLLKYFDNAITWSSDSAEKQYVTVNVTYDTANSSKQYGDSRNWTPNAEVPNVSDADKYGDGFARRKMLMKEAMESINLAKAGVLDVTFELSASENIKLVATVAYGYSEVDIKSRLKYMLQTNVNHYPATEFAGSIEVKSPIANALNPEIKDKINSVTEFDAKLKMMDYFDDVLKLHGTFGRSQERKEYLLNTKEAEVCMKERENNGNVFVVCDPILVLADALDEFNVSVMLNQSYLFKPRILMVSENFDKVWPSMDIETNEVDPQNKDRERVDYSVRITPDNFLDVYVYCPNKDIKVKNFRTDDFVENYFEVEGHNSEVKNLINRSHNALLDEDAVESASYACVIDKSKVKTFDEKVYELGAMPCWHVVLTTFPEKDPQNPGKTRPIPEDKMISVIARDVANSFRETKVNLGSNEVTFYILDSKLKIKVNDGGVKVTKDNSYQHLEEGESVFEIFATNDNAVRIVAPKYEFSMEFDGKHFDIEASDAYYKSLRGLCGNLDSCPKNDLKTPKNTESQNSGEFVKSWSLLNDAQTCFEDPRNK